MTFASNWPGDLCDDPACPSCTLLRGRSTERPLPSTIAPARLTATALVPISRNLRPPVPRRPLVQLESPYAGDVEANEAYARACLRNSLERGEAPYASHLLYTQPGVLVDLDPEERAWGIEAGLAFLDACTSTALYVDRGISRGMVLGARRALDLGRGVDVRTIGGLSPEFLRVLVVMAGLGEPDVLGYRVILPKTGWVGSTVHHPTSAGDTRWWTAPRGVCNDTRTTTARCSVTLHHGRERGADHE